MPKFLSTAFIALIATALGTLIWGSIGYFILFNFFGEEVAFLGVILIGFGCFIYFYYDSIKDEFEGDIRKINTQLNTANAQNEALINSLLADKKTIINSMQTEKEALKKSILAEKEAALAENDAVLNHKLAQKEAMINEALAEIDRLSNENEGLIDSELKNKQIMVNAIMAEKDALRNSMLAEKEALSKSAKSEIEKINNEKDLYKQCLCEKSSGFPTLLSAISELEEIRDKEYESYLRYKKNPSKKGADVVKEQTKRRRDAEYELKKTKSIIEYYESIAPFLLDFKEEVALPEDEDILTEYTEEEREDAAIQFMTKQEYRKLPAVERNQVALDRFWKRHKSKWLIGRIYERFVGYLYEKQGYDVDYVGIFKGFEDLGRDLICTKGNEIVVIQCKNWSKFSTIYEKHIFQFFGTVFQYKDENKGKKVKAVFCTTTKLSDVARRFAKELKIELKEEFKMENAYPCIKCNIGKASKEKIYHLPFDQQYDKVKIEPKCGEFYCATVKEAEEQGFRRAFRHQATKAA